MYSVSSPNLDLDQIYESGQIFRWIKIRRGKYLIPYKDKALKVEQTKDRLTLNCTESEFYDFWFDFFDMGAKYDEMNSVIGNSSEYLEKCAERGKGIRIVKQDLFETIISFIVSQQQTIPRIRAILDHMSKEIGLTHKQGLRECGKVTWYEFPTYDKILAKAYKLPDCKLGYREKYIVEVCEAIAEGWLDLELLKSMDYESAKGYLMEFDGIGPKVADCVCLYALHHMQAFPVDTHIQSIIKREFGYDSASKFKDCVLWKSSGYEGLAQQYMFYNEIGGALL